MHRDAVQDQTISASSSHTSVFIAVAINCNVLLTHCYLQHDFIIQQLKERKKLQIALYCEYLLDISSTCEENIAMLNRPVTNVMILYLYNFILIAYV